MYYCKLCSRRQGEVQWSKKYALLSYEKKSIKKEEKKEVED